MTITTKQTTAMAILDRDDVKTEINILLDASKSLIEPAQFMSVASRLINENLKTCSLPSIQKAILSVATLGLSPDPTLGNAYILPYKGKDGDIAQLIIGYKGYIVLARRAGYEVLQYGAIHENDVFEEGRVGEAPTFRKARTNRGALQGAFCVLKTLNTGSITYTVLWEEEINKAKKSSKSANSDYSPWKTSPDEMYIKTALRYHCSRLPLLDKWKSLIATDSDDDTIVEREVNEPPAIKTLRAKLEVIRGTEFEEAEKEEIRNEWKTLFEGKSPVMLETGLEIIG